MSQRERKLLIMERKEKVSLLRRFLRRFCLQGRSHQLHPLLL